jgi:hypothetical protein
MLQYSVRTFIILTMVKSPGFGSNFRHYSVILTLGLPTCLFLALASNVNLVTHYAKGTFFSLYYFNRTAYKITISFIPLRYFTL